MIEKFANRAARKMLILAEEHIIAMEERISKLAEENTLLRETNRKLWQAQNPGQEEPNAVG